MITLAGETIPKMHRYLLDSIVHYALGVSHSVYNKVGSTYWGKIAQGPIQMLPIWDNTLALTCKNMPKGIVFGNTLIFPC